MNILLNTTYDYFLLIFILKYTFDVLGCKNGIRIIVQKILNYHFALLLSGADNQCLPSLPVNQTCPPHPFINQSKPVSRQPDIPIRECKWTLPV